MDNLFTEYTEEFGKAVLDVFSHEHSKANLMIVRDVTIIKFALLILIGDQELLFDFAKYYVANIIQQRGLL